MEESIRIIQPVIALALSPLMFGVINKVKAIFAGRQGQPLLQVYFDLWKLFHKETVYSKTTSWVFRASPVISIAAMLLLILLVPLGHRQAIISFDGDVFLIVYLFALIRFFMIIAALDTGSSFEGMGASREAQFSAISEPAFFLVLAAMACGTGKLSMSEILSSVSGQYWLANLGSILFVASALVIVLLAENARIPVDDPNTHLELTMIHEVMVLDNSGPDLGLIIMNSAMKLWVFAAILAALLVPNLGLGRWCDIGMCVGTIFVIAAAVGAIESCMARLRLIFVPHFIFAATVFAVLAMVFVLRSR